MTGLIRSRRISGRETETRQCTPRTAIVTAVATMFSALAMGGAIAQTPGTAGPISLNEVFQDEESGDLTPDGAQKIRDAAQRARAQGNCPKGTFTVVVKKGDDLFQQARAQARRDAILQILGDQARNFVTETDITGARNDVRVSYGAPRDNISPTLEVTWTPPKNTKVSHGRRITAKATARDDANRWQSGIKTIDFDVQGGGQFGFQDYPQPPQNCENAPPLQTSDGVYTVPNPEPPIVRLRARTRDFVGHSAQEIAEFPTGDWFGKITKQVNGGGHNHTVTIYYTFDVDRNGTIKARAYARIATQPAQIPGCTLTWTYSPSELAIPISGQRNGDNFEITIQAGETTDHIKSQCTASTGSNTFRTPGINPTSFGQTKFSVPARDGEKHTATISAGEPPWGVKMTDTIEIHKAQ
jgi:hypothetical protein